ncbi:MAG: DNA translocase FtsK [Candidatus Dormibacteraeota bacterium]|nr:DNA translocase FtsK [Candidatus Dormibacteraeota bacterium]
MLSGQPPLLRSIHGGLEGLFGAGWPLPVAACIALGGLWLWPRAPALPANVVAAALVSLLAAQGLLSLADAPWGGRLGGTTEGLLTTLAGPVGALVLLLLGFLLGLVLAFRFSPGAVLMGAATAARVALEERRRLEQLVRRARAEPAADQAGQSALPSPSLPPPAVPAVTTGEEGAAEPPPTAPAWTREVLEERMLRKPAAATEGEGVPQPVTPLRVVADPEDEPPEIDWRLPPLSLLDSVRAKRERMQEEIKRNVRVIESTLATFGVQARVIGVNSGPSVTQYELQPAAGVAVKRIVSLQNDLSLALAAAPLRIEAPIPGKSAVGVEVPNRAAQLVSIREVVESASFRNGSHTLGLALGNDVAGLPIVTDLARMPHLLIAGATGQGKSVCINVLVSSLLLQYTPDQLRMVMIDPKRVELQGYNELPHLATPVIVESHQAAGALRWATVEMERRYKMLATEGVRNIGGYNEKATAQAARTMPYIVIVIDELADLMMVAAGEVEELICRIAQLARAVGIHLVIATQRPSTDIITGLIKANIPSRIAFAVGSQVDSRVILDSSGAEKLLGRGDMLYLPVDAGKATRIQGAFVSDREVDHLCSFWKDQGEPRYIEEVLESGGAAGDFGAGSGSERRLDPLFARAARAVAAEGGASVSLVQRKFNVGYSRAGRIVDQLAEHRVIGSYQGSKSREVMMSLPDVDELLEQLGVEG